MFVVASSTVYDLVFRQLKVDRHALLVSFSLYTNGQNLFNMKTSKNDIRCLHGIRVLSIVWILLGHRYFLYLLMPGMNPIEFITTVSLFALFRFI
jgi:hypothetical protein